jgi:transcriptional regulator with XRE-family HTH domain
MPKKQRKERQRGGMHPMDIHVGRRVRTRRTVLGLSQTALGDKIGLTFQQVQKYERGANRISASRLFEIARVLEVTPMYFFEEFDKNAPPAPQTTREQRENDPLYRRETLELVRNYYAIESPLVRQRIHDLAKACARTAA